MIRYLNHEVIDKDKWDACISKAFNGLVYAYSWYLDTVCLGWEALVEDDYFSVFPLTGSKKMGIYYLYQPFFAQQLGIFSKNLLSEEKVSMYLEAIPHKYKLIEINLNTFNKLNCSIYNCIPNKNHLLDLINSYESISRSYSENLKRNIKKAEKENLSLSKHIKPEEIITLFRDNRGKEFMKLKEQQYRMLQKLIYLSIYKGYAETWGVFDGTNELCAGAVFLKGLKRAIFLFSGLSETGRQSGSMPFLIDAFIREHAHQELTLDFEGSNDPSLARFYKSFGSKENTYLQFRKNAINPFLYQGVRMVRWLRKY